MIIGMIAATLETAAFAQAQPSGSSTAGASKISMCIGCHSIPGYKASFPIVYSVPAIGGQSEGYIANALHAYQSGDRKHPTMQGIARGLSAQDIQDVAAYYAAQK